MGALLRRRRREKSLAPVGIPTHDLPVMRHAVYRYPNTTTLTSSCWQQDTTGLRKRYRSDGVTFRRLPDKSGLHQFQVLLNPVPLVGSTKLVLAKSLLLLFLERKKLKGFSTEDGLKNKIVSI